MGDDAVKVLVCGGREYADGEFLALFLDDLVMHQRAHGDQITHLIHGNARGADKLAAGWAVLRGIQPVACAAIWELGGVYDPRAGLKRNIAMLALDPDVVVAFPGGSGTAHMVKAAQGAGVRVIR